MRTQEETQGGTYFSFGNCKDIRFSVPLTLTEGKEGKDSYESNPFNFAHMEKCTERKYKPYNPANHIIMW